MFLQVVVRWKTPNVSRLCLAVIIVKTENTFALQLREVSAEEEMLQILKIIFLEPFTRQKTDVGLQRVESVSTSTVESLGHDQVGKKTHRENVEDHCTESVTCLTSNKDRNRSRT